MINTKKIYYTLFPALQMTLIALIPLIGMIDKVAKTYSVEESPYIGGVLWGYGPCERINKEEFFRPVKVEFEGKMYPAPTGYDTWLRNIYGDYMTLPPEEKRMTHSFEAWSDMNEEDKK